MGIPGRSRLLLLVVFSGANRGLGVSSWLLRLPSAWKEPESRPGAGAGLGATCAGGSAMGSRKLLVDVLGTLLPAHGGSSCPLAVNGIIELRRRVRCALGGHREGWRETAAGVEDGGGSRSFTPPALNVLLGVGNQILPPVTWVWSKPRPTTLL